MTTTSRNHVIDSVADAQQFISCYHPQDFNRELRQACLKEGSQAARDAMAQILTRSLICTHDVVRDIAAEPDTVESIAKHQATFLIAVT